MCTLPFSGKAGDSLYDLAWHLEIRYSETLLSDIDSAEHYACQLLQLGLDSNDNYLVARGYDCIGYTHYYRNQLEEAISCFKLALPMYRKMDMPEYEGGMFMALGSAIGDKGDFAKCLSMYQKADSLFTANPTYPEDRACLYYNMAHIFLDLDDDENLEVYLEKSDEIVRKDSLEHLVPAINNLRAYLAINRGEYARADSLGGEALRGSVIFNDEVEQVFALENLGRAARSTGSLERATAYLDSSLAAARAYGDPYMISEAMALLAHCYLQEKRLQDADSTALRAYNLGVSQNSVLLTRKVSKVYAEVLEAKGDFEKAYGVFKTFTQAKDSLIGYGINERILRTENRLSEQENRLLRSKAALLYTRNSRGQVIIVGVSCALLLSLTILFLLVRLLKARKKAALELQAKQEMIDQKSRELERTNTELHKINTGKDKLFSIISHDMKEPFNQMSSFLQLLEADPQLDDDLHEMINDMKSSTRSTLFAMNNLLMWSKSQFMNLQTETQKVDMHVVINNVLSELEASIHHKQLRLSTEVGNNTSLQADVNHVNIILRNLISNAIKFSPFGGEVQVIVTRNGNDVEIAVRDEGKGMSNEEVESLFDVQKHFSTPGTLNEKGTGLGMMIVSEFIRENKGRIEVDSQKNCGSTFRVMFPAA